MNPKGLVFAASITSQRSMFIRSQRSFISLTSAMFTQRKMFSSSLVSSASRVPFTGTTLVIVLAYSAQATSVHCVVFSPTTLGLFAVFYCGLSVLYVLG